METQATGFNGKTPTCHIHSTMLQYYFTKSKRQRFNKPLQTNIKPTPQTPPIQQKKWDKSYKEEYTGLQELDT